MSILRSSTLPSPMPHRSIRMEAFGPSHSKSSSYDLLLPPIAGDGQEDITYELGYEDEMKIYADGDYDSSCSDTSSDIERRLAGMQFGFMFPTSHLFGGCLRRGGQKIKRRFMMKFGKHFGRRAGVSRKAEDSRNNDGLLGIHNDIDRSNATSTGADVGRPGSMEIHPAPYRPVTIIDIENSKRDWKQTDKQQWKKRRTTMIPQDF